jgi:hypothetical protein
MYNYIKFLCTYLAYMCVYYALIYFEIVIVSL